MKQRPKKRQSRAEWLLKDAQDTLLEVSGDHAELRDSAEKKLRRYRNSIRAAIEILAPTDHEPGNARQAADRSGAMRTAAKAVLDDLEVWITANLDDLRKLGRF